jgi:hypothetical protein
MNIALGVLKEAAVGGPPSPLDAVATELVTDRVPATVKISP